MLNLVQKSIKNKYVFVFIVLGLSIVWFPSTSHAISAAGFNPGRIIDDSIFTNNVSMNVDQIQAFLNSKVPVCDNWGTNGSTPTSRRDFVVSHGYALPMTCLKDYTENGLSTAQIIYNAAQTYTINPQVLIVLLQKEQGLVTDEWPTENNYRSATGYGCPDTAPCDSQYYGLTNQINWSAHMFRAILNSSPTWWSPYVLGNNNIQWSPNAACGSSVVNIQNRSTQALYDYTPYQPNQAALNAGYGAGDGCSAYGNRNFYLYFNDWFGPSVGSGYSWSIEGLTYSGGDNLFTPGVAETATLTVRNTGVYTWYNNGDHTVRLGTWEPADTPSKVYTQGWLSNNRPTTLNEASVAPGEVGTFTFPITTPGIGAYAQSFNLVVENVVWMDWTGFRPTIIGLAPYQWSVDGVSYGNNTGVMQPGSTQTVTVTAHNTGSATWSKTSGPSIKLATWEPDRVSQVNQDWLSPTRIAYMSEDSVATGQSAQFQFSVKMPQSGYFYERLNLVAEGQAWFNNPGLTLYLKGGGYAWQSVWSSISTGSLSVNAGQEFTMTVKAKNTGDFTWYKSSGPSIRIGTSEPKNRGSNLYNSSWISDTRPTALIEDSVAPGQEGTFSFQATAPNRRGTFYESFNIVAEGQTWFESPSINFLLVVK